MTLPLNCYQFLKWDIL